jgi:uncharacterized protein (TIGR02594 family)
MAKIAKRAAAAGAKKTLAPKAARKSASSSSKSRSSASRSSAAIPPWLDVATKYLGVAEGPGIADNPQVIKFFIDAGHAEVTHDATPWCAAFVGAVLKEAALPHTGTLWALDYAHYGQALSEPVIGAIGVKKRNGGGHVFFVAGFDARFIYALGGNQNDRVCVSKIARSAVIAYRWPPGVPVWGAGAGAALVADATAARED